MTALGRPLARSRSYRCTPKAEVEALIPKMLKLRKKGMSYSKIGRELGLSPSTVHRRVSGLLK